MTSKKFEVPDQNLWDEVKRAIKPLSRRKSLKAKAKLQIIPLHYQPQVAEPVLVSKQLRSHPPALATIDRRMAQKLGRGKLEPEARIDLHGETLETARFQLLHFISNQRQRGLRTVLVITGKGASPFARHTLHGLDHFHTPEREGKLRREVPLWLHEAVFRTHVVGFQPSHPKHGGGGAFYVRLRKLDGEV